MTAIINASNTSGITFTSDTSGNLALQSNGTTIATATSAGFTYAGGIVQVVSYTDNTQRSTTSNTATASGFSASITPKFSTSKILVNFTGSVGVNTGSNTNDIGTLSVYRGSSTQLTAARVGGSAISGDFNTTVSMNYLDSPATTSSVTYNLYWSRYSGSYDSTIYLNVNTNTFGNGTSTMTLMEVAV